LLHFVFVIYKGGLPACDKKFSIIINVMETGFEKITKPQHTLLACIAFIAGAGVIFGDFWLYYAVVAAILLFLLVYLDYKNRISAGFAVICLVIFTFSAIYAQFRIPEPDMLYSLAPKKLELQGQVVSNPNDNREDRTKFLFNVYKARKKGAKWHDVKAKTIVYVYDDERTFENIRLGDHLELTASVNKPFKATNPGQFDYEKYLNRRGVFTMSYVRDDGYTITRQAKGDIWALLGRLDKVRDDMMNIHARQLKSPKLELLGGMVFGDNAVPAPEDVRTDFLNSGLFHLLAASGMNVGIIFGLWYFLAGLFKLPFASRIVIGMVLVAVYSLLTGLPPSITRATLMLELALIAKLINRKTDNILILVMVCVLMLLYNPLTFTDVGFQLSFIVTLGLLLFIPILTEKTKPVPEYLSGAILVPFVAQVFVTPIQTFHFNNFPVYSLLANMLAVPFVGIISFAGFLGSIFSLIPMAGGYLCALADKIAEPFLGLLLYLAEYTAHLPNAVKYLPKPDIPTIAIFYTMLLTLFLCMKNNFSVKKQNVSVAILVLTLLLLVFKGHLIPNRNLELLFFDVGEGDAILMKTPQNSYMMVDTGPHGRYNPAQMAIVPYFRAKGIKKLDAVLLTHPDSDHIGGTLHILQYINVEKVLHNGVNKETKTYRALNEYISRNNLNKAVVGDGDVINIDEKVKIHVIRPDNTDPRSDNEDSLILYITYGNFSALLMGDCEAESLKFLKRVVKPPVTLLKVGHHGSDNSVNDEFLSFINPEIAVISVGNKFYRTKHPHPEVIWWLEDFNTRILRTDKDYAVKISTNGDKLGVKTFRGGF
jgi:competence protein ComEC